MARKLDPQQAIERARAIHTAQIAALQALTAAHERLENLENTHREELEKLTKTHSSQQREAIKELTAALQAATTAGWNESQLQNLGIRIPDVKPKQAPRTRRTTTKSTDTASQDAQDSTSTT